MTFSWNVQNVKAVYFYAQGQNMQEYGVAGQGSQTECPPQTTTYYLTVVYTNGTSETQAITINVAPAPVGAPVISLFTVTPSQIQPGQCVNVQWDVQGSVTADHDHARQRHPVGTARPCGARCRTARPAPARVGYTLGGDGPGGQSQRQQYVNVVAPPTAVPPTAVPPTAVPPTASPADRQSATPPPTAVPPTAVPAAADRRQELAAADLQQRARRRWCRRSRAPRSRPCSAPMAR